MDFIGIKKNARPINDMHKKAMLECEEVWAAVAYVENQQIQQNNFIKSCIKENKPLKLYARYDYSLPVGLDILKWFLDQKSPNYSCRLVPDLLHSKIIWYRPYGIYIGSANLTWRAWNSNLEAGVFLTQYEMEKEQILFEVEDYFETIKSNAYDLTRDLYDSLYEYNEFKKKQDKKIRDEFKKISQLPSRKFFDAPEHRKDAMNRRRNKFIKEWNDTLDSFLKMAARVSDDYRPVWVSEDVPTGVQADQFLHAYYYDIVREGNQASKHREMHEVNKTDIEFHLVKAMKWWSELPKSRHQNEMHMYEWAPKLHNYFSQEKLLELTKDEFIDAMSMIHAFYEYSRQVPIYEKGYTQPERCEMLAAEVYDDINLNGESVLKVLYNVLYGGPQGKISERIFDACNDEKRKISYVGLSTIGEVVGWAMPDKFPPRNGRTSKALYALGYDVTIHTE